LGAGRGLSASRPVSIVIPTIKVRAKVIGLGLSRDGRISVPPVRTKFVTGWYHRGPTPGAPGASVILGHVDAEGVGPTVFYDLGELRPGDRIYVRLHSGKTAIFAAYSVALCNKTRFPTARVYGYTSCPTLRLVTCGGVFDRRTGHYLGDTVVFASYVGPAPRLSRAGRPGVSTIIGHIVTGRELNDIKISKRGISLRHGSGKQLTAI